MLQSCSQFICQWENEPGGGPIRIKHLLHSSAVRYGEIFHSPSAREISHLILYLVYSTVVFCYTRACNICPYFTSGYFFCALRNARNNEIDWEGTGGRSLTARTGA